MRYSAQFLNSSDAAKRLGVSVKALRLYERRGLLAPMRTEAGWRIYGPAEMTRAGEIVALRTLGLGLGQIADILRGDTKRLESALAEHQSALEDQSRQLAGTVAKIRALRADLALGQNPTAAELAQLRPPSAEPCVAFDLPWPWGGERFELRDIRPLNYIIGPLGSGKTRLARKIAEMLPGGTFLGLERLEDGGAQARARMENDPALRSNVDQTLARLVGKGASASPGLIALLAALGPKGSGALVVDMVEEGLDQASQEAVIDHLRNRGPDAPPVFLLTRSSAILDLTAVGTGEAIILCPANHRPPIRVAPYPGAPGYESVATCLASPEVRARTEGVIAWRPPGRQETAADAAPV
ncbi:MAG: MerR family transcriptional regulator [Shinella sp.]|nr:MerR family transcriptional regulator [Shinella sp.]